MSFRRGESSSVQKERIGIKLLILVAGIEITPPKAIPPVKAGLVRTQRLGRWGRLEAS